MRKILLLLALLFAGTICPRAKAITWTIDSATPTYTCTQGISSGTSMFCGTTNPHCAAIGTLIIVRVNFYQSSGQQTASMADTNGYIWTTRADTATAANNYRSYFFDTVATGSSCDTFTVTLSGTVTFGIMDVFQATPSSGTPVFDVTCSPTPACWVSNTSANPQTGSSFTTSAANDLIVATVACPAGSNGFGAGSGYTISHTSGANAWAAEYKTAGGAGSETPTFSNSQTCSAIISFVAVAYKTAATSNSGFPVVIKYRDGASHRRRIPWDDRKRKLEIVKI